MAAGDDAATVARARAGVLAGGQLRGRHRSRARARVAQRAGSGEAPRPVERRRGCRRGARKRESRRLASVARDGSAEPGRRRITRGLHPGLSAARSLSARWTCPWPSASRRTRRRASTPCSRARAWPLSRGASMTASRRRCASRRFARCATRGRRSPPPSRRLTANRRTRSARRRVRRTRPRRLPALPESPKTSEDATYETSVPYRTGVPKKEGEEDILRPISTRARRWSPPARSPCAARRRRTRTPSCAARRTRSWPTSRRRRARRFSSSISSARAATTSAPRGRTRLSSSTSATSAMTPKTSPRTLRDARTTTTRMTRTTRTTRTKAEAARRASLGRGGRFRDDDWIRDVSRDGRFRAPERARARAFGTGTETSSRRGGAARPGAARSRSRTRSRLIRPSAAPRRARRRGGSGARARRAASFTRTRRARTARRTVGRTGGSFRARGSRAEKKTGAKRWDAYVRENAPPTVRYARSKPTAEKNARRPLSPADTSGRTANDLSRWSRFVARETPAEVARARKALEAERSHQSRGGRGGRGGARAPRARARAARSACARAQCPRAAPLAGTALAPTRARLGEPAGPGPAAPVVRDPDRPLAPVDPNRPTWRERAAEVHPRRRRRAGGVGGARRGPHERALLRDGRVGLAGRRRETSRGGGGGVGVAPHDLFPTEGTNDRPGRARLYIRSTPAGPAARSDANAESVRRLRFRRVPWRRRISKTGGGSETIPPVRAWCTGEDSRLHDFDGFDFAPTDAARAPAAVGELAETRLYRNRFSIRLRIASTTPRERFDREWSYSSA